MRLYLSGIQPPKLGSMRDRVIQAHMVKESEKETKKNSLLTFIAMNTIPATTKEGLMEYESKIKKTWISYLELEYGVKMSEKTEKEIVMAEYYDKVVKKLKPKLVRKRGKLSVEGLEALKR